MEREERIFLLYISWLWENDSLKRRLGFLYKTESRGLIWKYLIITLKQKEQHSCTHDAPTHKSSNRRFKVCDLHRCTWERAFMLHTLISYYHTINYILYIIVFPNPCGIHIFPYTMGLLWDSISHSPNNHFGSLSIPIRCSHREEYEYTSIFHFHEINHTQIKTL